MCELPEITDCSQYIPCLCCDEFVCDAALGQPSMDPTCQVHGAMGMFSHSHKM